MHIGFDAKGFFHNATGLGNYARSTVLGLAEHFPEHRYTLYTPSQTGQFCTLPALHGLHVQEACPLGRAFPAMWRSLGIPWAALQDGLDIYHGLSHELPMTDFAARTRTVVSMHDLLFLTHPHLYPWVDRKLYAFKYKKSCQRADMVVAISQKTADDVHEIFGWIMPRFNDYSSSRAYMSWLMGKKEYALDARVKGGERHMIMSGEYDRVFPMDIFPEQLVKAIITGDIDRMEALGIYEVAPEDFALCEFVDSSKLEVQRIVREGLDMLRKEMA